MVGSKLTVTPEIDRVLPRLDMSDPDGCWEWPGARHTSGYGSVARRGKNSRAAVHRVVYEALVGPIPPGYHIDHLCRNPPCANPKHLEPVTPAENNRRGIGPAARNGAKTSCIRGHAFTPENTYTNKNSRSCRACHRAEAAAARVRRPVGTCPWCGRPEVADAIGRPLCRPCRASRYGRKVR